MDDDPHNIEATFETFQTLVGVGEPSDEQVETRDGHLIKLVLLNQGRRLVSLLWELLEHEAALTLDHERFVHTGTALCASFAYAFQTQFGGHCQAPQRRFLDEAWAAAARSKPKAKVVVMRPLTDTASTRQACRS